MSGPSKKDEKLRPGLRAEAAEFVPSWDKSSATASASAQVNSGYHGYNPEWSAAGYAYQNHAYYNPYSANPTGFQPYRKGPGYQRKPKTKANGLTKEHIPRSNDQFGSEYKVDESYTERKDAPGVDIPDQKITASLEQEVESSIVDAKIADKAPESTNESQDETKMTDTLISAEEVNNVQEMEQCEQDSSSNSKHIPETTEITHDNEKDETEPEIIVDPEVLEFIAKRKYPVDYMISIAPFFTDSLSSINPDRKCFLRYSPDRSLDPVFKSRPYGGKKSGKIYQATKKDDSVDELSLRSMVPELKPSENGFRITIAEGKEKVLREVKSILNKLTPEKFDKLQKDLITQLHNHIIYCEDIVNLIFEKAINETHFSGLYADLCIKLVQSLPQNHTNAKAVFRVALITKCQREFQKCSDEQEIVKSVHMDEDLLHQLNQRESGIVKFIGELYNYCLINEKVIKLCIRSMVPFEKNTSPIDEAKLEAISKLLTVIGSNLEKDTKDMEFFNILFANLKACAHNSTLSSRLRFSLKDLLELRESGWKPRRVVEEAKTISEIHAEAAAEASSSSFASVRSKKSSKGFGFKNKKTKSSGSVKSSESLDEWQTVEKKKVGAFQQVQVQKKNKSKSKNMENEDTPPLFTTQSYFNALQESEEEEGEEEELEQESSNLDDDSESADDEQSNQSVRLLLDEYISSLDLSEVDYAIKALPQKCRKHQIMFLGLSLVMERKPLDRINMQKLFSYVHKKQLISKEQLLLGLSNFTRLIDDIVIDVPKAIEYVSDFFAAFIQDGILDMHFFASDSFSECRSSGSLAKLLTHTIRKLRDDHSMDASQFGEICDKDLLGRITDLEGEALEQFLVENELQFLLMTEE